MPALLYVKLTFFLPELVWTVLGTYWAFDASSNCEVSLFSGGLDFSSIYK